MSGPLTDYQLGKIRHRELEAEVKPYWGKRVVRNDNPHLSSRQKLTLALSGATLTALLMAQMLIF
jgi:hypothetical protein